jgi:hypothetical protein
MALRAGSSAAAARTSVRLPVLRARRKRAYEPPLLVTHVILEEGAEPEWNDAMRQSLEAARGRRGSIGGELRMPLERLNERVVVGKAGVVPDTRRSPRSRWAAGRASPE